MRLTIGTLLLTCLLLGGCSTTEPSAPALSTGAPPNQTDPDRPIDEVSCGGPAFPLSLLDEPGRAETLDDPAAEALRRHLASPGPDFDWLPDTGWYEVARTDVEVSYIAEGAPGADPQYVGVTAVLEGDAWHVPSWGQCRLQAALEPGLGLATFRVAPNAELAPELNEIPVLVHERGCNSGQDARGRIVEPRIILGAEAVTVVFAVRPREGEHTCPGNPETPYLLVLPEPIGNRTLFDGSEIPPRDATQCADGVCAP